MSHAVPLPRKHRATVLPTDHQERRLTTWPGSARTEHRIPHLRKKQKHAMTDDISTATFNTHTHTYTHSETMTRDLLHPLTTAVAPTNLPQIKQPATFPFIITVALNCTILIPRVKICTQAKLQVKSPETTSTIHHTSIKNCKWE